MMHKNLKSLMLNFYKCYERQLEISRELEVLIDNSIEYNNGTDMEHLQKVLDHETEIEICHHKISHIDGEIAMLGRDIAEALELIGVPAEKKIPVDYGGPTKLHFWYDEYAVYYELAV